MHRHAPFILNGFDDKPESGTDSIHIFVHQMLDDGGLASIVKASA